MEGGHMEYDYQRNWHLAMHILVVDVGLYERLLSVEVLLLAI